MNERVGRSVGRSRVYTQFSAATLTRHWRSARSRRFVFISPVYSYNLNLAERLASVYTDALPIYGLDKIRGDRNTFFTRPFINKRWTVAFFFFVYFILNNKG